MKLVNFSEAIKKLESGEWDFATTESWAKTKTQIRINIRKYKQRKVLQLTHRDNSTTYWQISSTNIFEDKYMEAS